MKKVFAPILIVLSTFSAAYSQFSVGIHSGVSNKSFVLGLHSQFEFKNRFTAGFNLTTHMDNSNPAFLQSRFGYTIGNRQGISVQPYIGYSYSIQNPGKKSQGSQFTEGIRLQYHLKSIASIYADLNTPVSGLYMFSIGIAGRL